MSRCFDRKTRSRTVMISLVLAAGSIYRRPGHVNAGWPSQRSQRAFAESVISKDVCCSLISLLFSLSH